MGIRIFGGLTPLGTHLITHFLDEGMETWAIKSDQRKDSEEEYEMFFGRNALFRSDEEEDLRAIDPSYDHFCALLSKEDSKLDQTELLEKLDHYIENGMLKTILLIREIDTETQDVEGERLVLNEAELTIQTKINALTEKDPSIRLMIVHVFSDGLFGEKREGHSELRKAFAEKVTHLLQEKGRERPTCYKMLRASSIGDEEKNGKGEMFELIKCE